MVAQYGGEPEGARYSRGRNCFLLYNLILTERQNSHTIYKWGYRQCCTNHWRFLLAMSEIEYKVKSKCSREGAIIRAL